METRMREREASDMHFKGPAGHPVFLAIKEATTKQETLVEQAGAGREHGSPHFHAASALLSCVSGNNMDG
eukprot:9321058-Pyramimonas_sp.AAC.1